MSNVIAIIGAKGTGKSTLIKEMIKNVHPDALFIYDVNYEYLEFHDNKILEVDEFINKMVKLKKAVMVFEEGALFFSNKGRDKYMQRILGLARHTKNTIIVCFYSFRSLPLYMYDLINTVILFKTKDTPSSIERKFQDDNLLHLFMEVRTSNNIHENRQYEAHELIMK